MATSKELRERIAAKETEVLKYADTLSKTAKAKRDAEKEIAAIKDELLDVLQTEAENKGKGK